MLAEGAPRPAKGKCLYPPSSRGDQDGYTQSVATSSEQSPERFRWIRWAADWRTHHKVYRRDGRNGREW